MKHKLPVILIILAALIINDELLGLMAASACVIVLLIPWIFKNEKGWTNETNGESAPVFRAEPKRHRKRSIRKAKNQFTYEGFIYLK